MFTKFQLVSVNLPYMLFLNIDILVTSNVVFEGGVALRQFGESKFVKKINK